MAAYTTIVLIIVMTISIGTAALRLEMISMEDQVLLSQTIGLDSLTDLLSERWIEKAETLKKLAHNNVNCRKSLHDLSDKLVVQSKALRKAEKSNDMIGIMNQVEILTTEANHYLHLILSKQNRQSVYNFLQVVTFTNVILVSINTCEFMILYTFFSGCSAILDDLIESEYTQASCVYLHAAKGLCQRAIANCEQYQYSAFKHAHKPAVDLYFMGYGHRVFVQMLKELVWTLLSFYESSFLLYEHNEGIATLNTSTIPQVDIESSTHEKYGITDKVIRHPVRLEDQVTVPSRGIYLFAVHFASSSYAYTLKIDGQLYLDQTPSTSYQKGRKYEENADSRSSLLQAANECLVDLTNKTQVMVVLYIVNPFAKTNISDVKVKYEKMKGDAGDYYYYRSSGRRSRAKETKLAYKPIAIARQ